MHISAPLLYAAYLQPNYSGPVTKIKLSPLRKLTKTAGMQNAANLRVLRYITIGVALLIGTGVAVAVFIMLA